MVICHDLEGKLRDKIWGVQIVPETDEVDLDNILGNRWLRAIGSILMPTKSEIPY